MKPDYPSSVFPCRRRFVRFSIPAFLAAFILVAPSIGFAQPILSVQPRDAVVVEGQIPGFLVVGSQSAGRLTFQWFRNDVAIPGATSDRIYPDPVTAVDDGTRYHVELTDSNGTTVSDWAYIRISDYTSDIEMPRPNPAMADFHLDAVDGDDDTGDGSADAPFRTFERVRPLLQGGEIVLFHSGEYGNITLDRSAGTMPFPFTDWVTLMAAPGADAVLERVFLHGEHEAHRVLWNGNFDMRVRLIGFTMSNGIRVQNVNFVRVENCMINIPGPYNDTEASLERSAVSIRGSRSVTVEDCEITKTAHGVTIRANDVTLRRTKIHRIAHDGIRLTGSDTVRIDNNQIFNTDDGFTDDESDFPRHADGIQTFSEASGPEPVNKNNNIFIRGNRIYHHETINIIVHDVGSRNWVMENNVFGPSGGFMLHLKANLHGFIFRHNSIVYVPGESYQGLYRTIYTNNYWLAMPTNSGSSGVQVYNNIIRGPVAGSEFTILPQYADRFDSNLYHHRTNPHPNIGENAIVEDIDPFSNPFSYDGMIVPETAAIGAGSTIDPIPVDMYGIPRGSPPTIGAVEYVDYDDDIPPSVPGNLSAEPGYNSVDLSWAPSTDNTMVAGYVVYRDGAKVATTHTNHFRDRALHALTPYTYTVSAFDPAGNESAESDALNVTTAAVPVNLAVNRPVAASSAAETRRAFNAVDGTILSSWSPTGDAPHWLEVDLEAEYYLDYAELISGRESGTAVAGFKLQYWKDGNWTDIPGASVADNDATEVVVVFGETVISDRIRFQSAESPIEVNQLRVFGEALDSEPPTTPEDLSASPGIDRIFLSWEPSTDNVGVTGYVVYRYGIQIASVSETHYLDTPLSSDSTYVYAVSAVDAAGNESTLTPIVTVATLPIPSWGGINITDFAWQVVDTGGWMGRLLIDHEPWLWSQHLSSWIYAPDPGDVRDVWVYVPLVADGSDNQGGSGWGGFAESGVDRVDTGGWLGVLHTTTYPWLWSESLSHWIYAPDPGPHSDGAWIQIEQYFWRGDPSVFTSVDIGNVNTAGTIEYSEGSFTVTGDGSDIWGTGDNCHFAYKMLSGDFDVSVRVTELDAVRDWTKVGLMFRESLDQDSKNVFMMLSPNGTVFQERRETGGSTGWGTGHSGGEIYAPPVYLRVVRQGDTFTGYYSRDGVQWSRRSHQEITMPQEIHFGFAVTSYSFGSTATGVFDRLSIHRM